MWQVILGFLGGDNGPLAKILALIPDPNARAKAKEAFERELQSAIEKNEQGQLEVNKAEATNASMFVAGWRPAVGWTCCFAMSWQYVLQPLFTWVLAVVATYSHQTLPALPILDTSQMYTVLLGMLGLGSMRTFEKFRAVDRSTLREP